MGKTNVKPHNKSQGMNFTEQICKQAQPKQVHQPTFSHPSHSLQGEGGACGHEVSAVGGTPSAALLLVYLLFLKSCIDFNFFFGCTAWPMGSWFLDQGSDSQPLQCKCRVLTTRLGKAPIFYLLPEQAGKQAGQWENTQTGSRS